jgi:hypothetical protein
VSIVVCAGCCCSFLNKEKQALASQKREKGRLTKAPPRPPRALSSNASSQQSNLAALCEYLYAKSTRFTIILKHKYLDIEEKYLIYIGESLKSSPDNYNYFVNSHCRDQQQ